MRCSFWCVPQGTINLFVPNGKNISCTHVEDKPFYLQGGIKTFFTKGETNFLHQGRGQTFLHEGVDKHLLLMAAVAILILGKK